MGQAGQGESAPAALALPHSGPSPPETLLRVINLHAALHQGNAVHSSHWPKSSQAEQVPSVTLAPCPPQGKGLSHRRINGMGQGPAIIFQVLGSPWGYRQGCCLIGS